jgi:hypothetical protein
MKLLTEDAVLRCDHRARVVNRPSQTLVRIEGRRVLVHDDPEDRPITMCPNISATIKPCSTTRKVDVGYSPFVRIEGHAICLDTVSGLTNGTPPDTVKYTVNSPGQDLVSEL